MFKSFQDSPTRLHGLDHLRAIAILLVMVFHYGKGIPSWLEPVKQIGWTGVDLFFVLSGYLIGYQLMKEYELNQKISFKKFYIKRFFRIVPAYITVLIVYFSLSNLSEGNGLPSIWRFLTFTQNFGLEPQTQNSFSHAWSLCIEEQFYLLLPVAIMLVFTARVQKATPYIILGLIGVGFFMRIYNWNEYVQPFIDEGNRRQMVYNFQEYVYYPSYNRMDGLLIGVLIAAIFIFKPKLAEFISRFGNIVLLLGLLLFVFAYYICESLISFRSMVFGLPAISLAYGLIVMGAVSPTCILYRIKSGITFIIATLSYAIYLSHKQIYHLVKVLVSNNDFFSHWMFWLCFAAAIIGGLVLHLAIEKPFLKFRQRILSCEKRSFRFSFLQKQG